MYPIFGVFEQVDLSPGAAPEFVRSVSKHGTTVIKNHTFVGSGGNGDVLFVPTFEVGGFDADDGTPAREVFEGKVADDAYLTVLSAGISRGDTCLTTRVPTVR